MTARRLVVTVAVMLTAVLVQLCALDELRLPFGPPDLPLLAVIALALRWGSEWGACVGFATGLLLDIAPPSEHAIGRFALAYALVGYFAGLLEDSDQTSVLTTIVVVIAGAAGLVVVDALTAAALGDGAVSGRLLARLLIATVGYDVVLAPLVVPLLSRLTRRLEPAGTW